MSVVILSSIQRDSKNFFTHWKVLRVIFETSERVLMAHVNLFFLLTAIKNNFRPRISLLLFAAAAIIVADVVAARIRFHGDDTRNFFSRLNAEGSGGTTKLKTNAKEKMFLFLLLMF